jgi:hypothetical protein
MLARGIQMRLGKLEGARRTGVFYLAWGRDDVEIAGKLDRARARGIVGRGDLIVRAHWNGRNGPPLSRWIVGRMREWSDEEGEALTAEMERRIAAKERPTGSPTSPQMQDKLRQMTDAELLAAALGDCVLMSERNAIPVRPCRCWINSPPGCEWRIVAGLRFRHTHARA